MKPLEHYLYMSPEIWIAMQALGIMFTALEETNGHPLALAGIADLEKKLETYIRLHRRLWGEGGSNDHSDG